MLSEAYLGEDVTWPRFISVASQEMHLRAGCVPKLAWKFSNGPGSKVWVTLSDEHSYKHMMEAGAKQIWACAKRESNLKDPNLALGWRIDLRVLNKVQRKGPEEGDEGEVELLKKKKEKEKAKAKAKKKKLKGKVSTVKQKCGGPKKVSTFLD